MRIYFPPNKKNPPYLLGVATVQNAPRNRAGVCYEGFGLRDVDGVCEPQSRRDEETSFGQGRTD